MGNSWIGFSSITVPGVTHNSAYNAYDAVGSAFEVELVGGSNGGLLANAALFDRGTANPEVRIHMFATGVSGSVNGVPFEVADADERYYLGYMDAGTWVSAGSAKTVTHISASQRGLYSVSAARSVHMQMQALANFTAGNTANPYRLNMLTVMD